MTFDMYNIDPDDTHVYTVVLRAVAVSKVAMAV